MNIWVFVAFVVLILVGAYMLTHGRGIMAHILALLAWGPVTLWGIWVVGYFGYIDYSRIFFVIPLVVGVVLAVVSIVMHNRFLGIVRFIGWWLLIVAIISIVTSVPAWPWTSAPEPNPIATESCENLLQGFEQDIADEKAVHAQELKAVTPAALEKLSIESYTLGQRIAYKRTAMLSERPECVAQVSRPQARADVVVLPKGGLAVSFDASRSLGHHDTCSWDLDDPNVANDVRDGAEVRGKLVPDGCKFVYTYTEASGHRYPVLTVTDEFGRIASDKVHIYLGR